MMYYYNEDDDRSFAAELAASHRYSEGYKAGYEQGLKDTVRHGMWVWVGYRSRGAYWVKCSVCDARSQNIGYRYCPYCGARMDER